MSFIFKANYNVSFDPVTTALVVAAATATASAATVRQGVMDSKASKSAAGAAAGRADAAAKGLADAQSTASSQASEILRRRKVAQTQSQSVYTSPLGLSGTATTARRTLLGQ